MFKLVAIDFKKILTPENLQVALRVALLLGLGFLALKIITVIAAKVSRNRLSPQAAMILRKAIFYTGATLILINVLQQLGFNLGALLGAAGIVGIAIGFASQTSISNLISGLFLLSEKPFAVGDVIKIGETVGIISSIDLMSTKIRTFDNKFIRIPNEKILNTELTNITYFPIRRLDIMIRISYQEDFNRVRGVLLELAEKNPFCLNEPEPIIIFNDFGEYACEILFGIWYAKEDFLSVKNTIMREIRERFRSEGIEVPYPQRSLHGASSEGALGVRIVNPPGGKQGRKA